MGTLHTVCLAFVLTAGLAGPAVAAQLKPGKPKVVAVGGKIYKQHCASCHGVDLEGEENWRSPKASGRLPAPPHSEKGHTWHHADTALFELTKYGLQKFAGESYESDMPAYKDILSDHEIVAVLSYIKSRWPSDIQEYHDHLNEQARKVKE